MHALNKKYDKVVCINLVDRPDKKKKMQAKFDRLGIEVEWFTAVKYGFASKIVRAINEVKVGKFNNSQTNEIGCTISHYTVIKQALAEGHKNIFVFEDDILFHTNFNNMLDAYLDKLPADYDMMMLYSFMTALTKENTKINSRWMKAFRSWSLVAYGMERSYMEKYIENLDKFIETADMVTYRLQMDDSLKQFVAAPTLVLPDTTDGSDIRTSINYEKTPTIINMGVKYEYE